MAIEFYRAQVETALINFIDQMGQENRLQEACKYALLNGGKRLRPILVQMIAEGINLGADVMLSALSVEFFHTASLIADDLPCMDNDDFRRNRPSLHKAFGENTAILASYALIAEGYGGIHRNGQGQAERALICLEAATRCAGIRGATNGQYLDLFPPDHTLETVLKIIYQKTVTLFEIAFLFGWVFGGGSLQMLEEVKRAAYHLGMAFQIADDLIDDSQDSRISMVIAVGKKQASQLFEEEMRGLKKSLQNLGLWNPPFQEVIAWLESYGKCTPRVIQKLGDAKEAPRI